MGWWDEVKLRKPITYSQIAAKTIGYTAAVVAVHLLRKGGKSG